MKITHRSASTAQHTPGVRNQNTHRVCVGLVVWGLIAGAVLGGTSPAWAKEKVEDGWYPFSFPEKLDPDSPANIGKLVLDAPAGKHGFVKVKDGHFYFEDGTRAKFWGTNLCFNANFPDKKQAEMLADRIAFFGFNAVRLHHMDFGFEPTGIFEDVAPMYKDPQMKETGTLSKQQLKRLDYLIYLLKQRGIYADMNLLVARHFTKADGVIDADKLGMAAKPVSMFDPKLIELQKQYAKDLLTHKNPYTKLRYVDEPAMALVEIINEASIIYSWNINKLNGPFYGFKKNPIPDGYARMLDQRWNEWLKSKYGTVENLKKVWSVFASPPPQGSTAIINNASDIASWQIEQHGGAQALAQTAGATAHVTIRKTTATPWHLQFRRSGFDLKKDKVYLITFAAEATTPTQIQLISQRASAPWTSLGLSETIPLSAESKNFEIPFVPNTDCTNAKVGFIIGQAQNAITLEDIIIREVPFGSLSKDVETSTFSFNRPLKKLLLLEPEQKQKDITQFYKDLQAAYFTTMSDYLKKNLGIKVPTGIGSFAIPENITTEGALDFFDNHTYWDHPQFPNKDWDMTDFRIHNKSMLADPTLGIIGAISQATKAQKDKPITITEWSHSYPNIHAYETPVLIAAEALNSDWDGLFQFAFSHGWALEPELNSIHSYFDIAGNAQQLLLDSIGSLVLKATTPITRNVASGVFTTNSPIIKGAVGAIGSKTSNLDGLALKSANNGAVFLYAIDGSPIATSKQMNLIVLGQIKNKASSWNGNTFNWGKDPTMIEKIDASIMINTSNSRLKAYALDKSGKRADSLPVAYANGVLTLSTKNLDSPWIEISDQQ